MTRPPVVAGQFYPAAPDRLRALLDTYQPPDAAPRTVRGLIAPHAGYPYSGAVAGAAFGRAVVPDRVLLLGPNHTGLGARGAVSPASGWATPLGVAPVDQELAGALLAACPLLTADGAAHAREHSLEVLVPFLQHRNPGVRLVPVALALRTAEEVLELGEAVAGVLARWPEPVLLVASSDLTHYEPDRTAREKDRLALERVLALDAPGLLATVAEHRITMCGAVPTAVLLTAAKGLGAAGGELARYATSGDVTGDGARVVGYAGVLIP